MNVTRLCVCMYVYMCIYVYMYIDYVHFVSLSICPMRDMMTTISSQLMNVIRLCMYVYMWIHRHNCLIEAHTCTLTYTYHMRSHKHTAFSLLHTHTHTHTYTHTCSPRNTVMCSVGVMNNIPNFACLLLRYTTDSLHYMNEVIMCPEFAEHGKFGFHTLGLAPVCVYVYICMTSMRLALRVRVCVCIRVSCCDSRWILNKAVFV